ncbi:BspA family leucine-rich repeat surface protein [Miniphocaeibacter massiliensis]|uniref:BspA family leucine-rich repeat surface protein n=1 Tax=Miniphocaeibacter massiliensis TaxID=2041841 RepID=UPI000C079A8E|nr:BspA family leucine-rich repeat surface protein [Miniphocaeibacter massiliensis]
MKEKSKVILASLLLLSILFQVVPVYATTIENDLPKEEVKVSEDLTVEKEEVEELVKENITKQGENTVTGTWGTCHWTFHADTGELVIGAGELTGYTNSPWNKGEIPSLDILKITLDGEVIAPANSSYLFSSHNSQKYLGELKYIENGNNLDTSNVTNMSYMFYCLGSLESIDVSSWDTSNVTSMSVMFYSATSLKSLDVSNWDTSNVTSMSAMFSGTYSLENLNVSSWDTSNVTNMYRVFFGAGSLKSLDVSNWDVSNVKNMEGMFRGAGSLKSLDVSNWDVSNTRNMANMFYQAISLKSLDLSNWNASNVYMVDMFYQTKALGSICLGKNFKFNEYNGLPTGSFPYSDSWLGKNTGKLYNTTNEFVTNYDGTNPDIYNRIPLKYEVIYMNGDTELGRDGNISVLDEYKTKDGKEFTIEGKKIVSWNKKADGTGKKYPLNSVLNIDVHSYIVTMVLYAQLEDYVEYTVRYEPNGGQFTDGTTTAKKIKVEKGNKITPENVSKENHSFEGWYTDKELTKAYNFELAVTSDITLYAKYKENPVPGYTVTGTWGTCPWTFYYDTGELVVGAGELTDYNNSPWNKEEVSSSDILKITLAGEVVAPADSRYLFSSNLNGKYLNNLKSIENGNNLNTSNVTSMNSMFEGVNSLESLDISTWNTSNVTDISYMFVSNSSLENLDISSWDTSKVTNMSSMFNGTSSLENLDISSWDTSNVTRMELMFYGASSLKSLNVSSWDTSNVANMYRVFFGTGSLESLDVSNWDTSNVVYMSGMFSETSSLENLDVSNWDTSNVITMSGMFSGASSLKSLNVSSWDTSNVTNMSYMFSEASSLKSLDASRWDTSNVTNMSYMFSEASSLKSLDASRWDTSNVINISYMFFGASSLESIEASNWDTSNVTNMRYMFNNATTLKNLNVSNWDTSKVNSMSYMFFGASSLKTLDLSNWDTSNVDFMSGIFGNTFSLESITLGEKIKFVEYTYLPKGSYPYTDSWIGEKTGTLYNTTNEFVTNYDGTNPDTYSRVPLKYEVIYMNGEVELGKDTDVSVLEEYKTKGRKDFTIEGKSIVSWNTKADGTGTEYPLNVVLNIDENSYKEKITLYAQLKDYVEHTVRYEPNGGKFIDGTTTAKEITVEEGNKITPEKVSKVNHSFEGWYTDKELTKAYNFELPVTSNLTLYAKYKENPTVPETKKITLVGGDAVLSNNISKQLSKYKPTRLAGSNRYTTSVSVSKNSYKKADIVILASGENYADKLTATVLANTMDSPILLTSKASLPKEILTEIQRLSPTKIIIIGGEGAISKNVEKPLSKYKIERIVGASRYGTAVKVGERIRKEGGDKTEAILVSGENFPDAIAMTTKAMQNNTPILLTTSKELEQNTEKALKGWKVGKVTIGGGEVAVSNKAQSTVNKITKSTRISGANRYDTSVKIAKSVYPTPNHIVIASGENFPDAIVGSVYASKNKAPIVLSNKTSVPKVVMDYINK